MTLYRQEADREYTLLAYHKARAERAYELAKRIRWANESLTKEFDLADKHVVLIPVYTREGWDS
jgi:hypothetical protein